MNLPARGDGRGGDEVRDDHQAHDDRRDDHQARDDRRDDHQDDRRVHDAHDDRGVPSGADRLVRRAPDRGRGIQRAEAGTEGKVRDGEEGREGTIHDGEAEVEGKVRDEESREGMVHGVNGEGDLANLQEGAHRHHPLAGVHSE